MKSNFIHELKVQINHVELEAQIYEIHVIKKLKVNVKGKLLMCYGVTVEDVSRIQTSRHLFSHKICNPHLQKWTII